MLRSHRHKPPDRAERGKKGRYIHGACSGLRPRVRTCVYVRAQEGEQTGFHHQIASVAFIGVFPPPTHLLTFGLQCGFCEIGPLGSLCRVIYCRPGSWIDSGEERRADRPSFSWVSSLVSPVRPSGRPAARSLEHLQPTLTLPRSPFLLIVILSSIRAGPRSREWS